MCFSYSNDGRTYAFSQINEFYQKALFYAVMFAEIKPIENILRLDFSDVLTQSTTGGRMSAIRKVLWESTLPEELQQTFSHPQILQRLNRLYRLSALRGKRIEIFNSDYRAINIQPNSIIYCDIPYLNTQKYTNGIDHRKFSVWCRRQVAPVYVSSYEINAPGFEVVAEIEKRVLMDVRRSKNQFKMERLYKYRRP